MDIIQIPVLITVGILNSRTIFTMELSLSIPKLTTVGILTGRTIFSMELAALEVIPHYGFTVYCNLIGLHGFTLSVGLPMIAQNSYLLFLLIDLLEISNVIGPTSLRVVTPVLLVGRLVLSLLRRLVFV